MINKNYQKQNDQSFEIEEIVTNSFNSVIVEYTTKDASCETPTEMELCRECLALEEYVIEIERKSNKLLNKTLHW